MTFNQSIMIVGFLILVKGILGLFGIDLPDLRGGAAIHPKQDVIIGLVVIFITFFFEYKKKS